MTPAKKRKKKLDPWSAAIAMLEAALERGEVITVRYEDDRATIEVPGVQLVNPVPRCGAIIAGAK